MRTLAIAVCTAVAVLAGTVTAEAKRPPRLASPKDGARSQSVPPFSWKRVGGAATYEFQLAADRRFRSIVDEGSFETRNTFATLDEALADGDYFWRVRSINRRDNAGRWSRVRHIIKRWNAAPKLRAPIAGEAIAFPQTPLVLRWNRVPRASRYLVWIGTDPTLAGVDDPIETSGTVYSPSRALAPGRYYWAVTPLDAQEHRGRRSAVGSFTWTWPTSTAPQVFDLNTDARVFDPAFAWNPIPGAANYEVEINPSDDFAVGSRVCCTEDAIGNSLSPKETLPNNTYHWRLRAINVDGQAGAWNRGTSFRKTFDDVVPTIPNLHMRDLDAAGTDVDPTTPTVLDMNYPIVAWDPVPGAASYQLEITEFDSGSGCDWSDLAWNIETAATAWTPLGRHTADESPVPNGPSVAEDGLQSQLTPGSSYCVRVLAINDVISEWTYLATDTTPAFRYLAPPSGGLPADGNSASFRMPSAAYTQPGVNELSTSLPLFVWQPITGAAGYYVVVARDAAFTEVVDVAFTNLPMYAPRRGRDVKTYTDETTAYYWAVVLAKDSKGGGFNTQPTQNNPRPFQKRSTPPAPITPSDGADIAQPTVFRWTSAQGADDYQLQVASDPSFGDPIDDVTTAATSYTSEDTYPADTVLYWRVRANDAAGVGLTWSEVRTFRRRLAIPTLPSGNPKRGSTIPVLRWNPVEGAVSYDIHIQQADGSDRDFRSLRGTAFTATTWFGTGVWRWQVRANFGSVHGGYTKRQSFTRHIATPRRLRKVNRARRVLLSWKPAKEAESYRVEISDTDSFGLADESARTDFTAWAPTLTDSDLVDGGKFFWRVAAVDEGGNVGGWRTARIRIRR